MLQVRVGDYAADDTSLEKVGPGAERDATGARPVLKARFVDDLHLREVAAILRRRRRFILASAGIGALLAAVVGLLIPPKYTATAQLVIGVPTVAAERASGVSAIDESIDTHVTLLSSRDHLRRVIESFRQNPEIRAKVPNTNELEPASGVTPGALRPTASDHSTDPTAPETTGLSELGHRLNVWFGGFHWSRRSTGPSLEDFERSTKIIQERRSRVISVGFTSTSPQKAAAFVNRIVQLYVAGLTEQKQASARLKLAELNEQIAEAKYEVEKARAAVQREGPQGRSSEQNASGEERAADRHLRDLLRRASSSAQRYDSLLRSRKELRDQQEFVSSGVDNLLLAEVPKRPSSHNPILFIVPAFILFTIGASWLAIVLERLDRGLRSRQETADALGITCIGLVPLLPKKRAIRADRLLLSEPHCAYSEAIRSAVGSLGLAGSTRNTKVLLVGSSVPGEGKTTLATSIAACVGALGRRALLVDLDFRRGSRLRELDQAAARGGVEIAAPNRTPVELIRHIAAAGFDYLPIAGCCVDPLALFASEQMPGIIRQMRERYDCVIVDGPPILGAAEARLLPSIADKLLWVVKWGSTKREVAQNALGVLYDTGSLNRDRSDRVMAIVTQVDLEKHARYDFGDVGKFPVKKETYPSRSSETRTDTGHAELMARAK
jgi:uncharacterized protein involved in exopolysaccharide biosynthesis